MSDVNKQLLDALRIARKKLDDEGYFPTEEIDLAIAAADQAEQADHIVEATEMAQQAEPVAWDSIEAVAAGRYKVVPSHESMFHRFAVVAGDGEQQLYLGRKVECENMARKFSGAFLDGAFAYQQVIEPSHPPAVAVAVPDELFVRAKTAVAYSHNFALSKPGIGTEEKDHIIGLCYVLRAMLAAAQKGGA